MHIVPSPPGQIDWSTRASLFPARISARSAAAMTDNHTRQVMKLTTPRDHRAAGHAEVDVAPQPSRDEPPWLTEEIPPPTWKRLRDSPLAEAVPAADAQSASRPVACQPAHPRFDGRRFPT